MKAREAINAALVEWREVAAAELANETFGQLDKDEITRLARRAYTEEWRSALREKDDDGVPKYASVRVLDETGSPRHIYKQTAMFSAEDYEMAAQYHLREARSHMRTAKALAKRCEAVFSHQLSFEIPELEAGGH